MPITAPAVRTIATGCQAVTASAIAGAVVGGAAMVTLGSLLLAGLRLADPWTVTASSATDVQGT